MDGYWQYRVRDVMQFSISHLLDMAYWAGTSEQGEKWHRRYVMYDIVTRGSWFLGHGCSYNLLLESSIPGVVDIKQANFKVIGMKELDDHHDATEILFSAQSVIDEVINRIKWTTRIAYCDGPFCLQHGRGLVCKPFGNKWLCERCINAYSLPAPTIEPKNTSIKEKKEREKMTASLRWKILERDNFTCKACGAYGEGVVLHVDHKIPIARGGLTVEDNLHTLCRQCNLGKRDKMPRQETLDIWMSE